MRLLEKGWNKDWGFWRFPLLKYWHGMVTLKGRIMKISEAPVDRTSDWIIASQELIEEERMSEEVRSSRMREEFDRGNSKNNK